MFPHWNWTMIAVSVSFHSVAILSTVFRLWYRWYTALMWWDDAWAMPAFLADIAFLIVIVLEKPIPPDNVPRFFTVGNWIISFAYPTLMWATRISILTSMVRVSRPEGTLKHIIVGTGIFFGLMGIAMLAQRIQVCIARACLMTRKVFITQITMDCIADVLLSALPIWFLRDMSLGRKRKILISSVFAASMVINIVTVLEAVAVLRVVTSGSIIFAHVKVACSMIVCNLLVIVTFVYRILHKRETGLEDSTPEASKLELTTIDLALGGLSQETSKEKPLSSRSGTTRTSGSFRGASGSRSKASGSVTSAVSQIDTLSAVASEDKYYDRSIS